MTLHRVYVCSICNCVGWFYLCILSACVCWDSEVVLMSCETWWRVRITAHMLYVCGFRKMWILQTKPRSLALSCFSVLQAIKSWVGPGKKANTWTFSIQSPTDSLHPTVRNSHDHPPSPCVCPVLGAVVPSPSASDQQCHSGGTHEDAEQEPHNTVTLWGQITYVCDTRLSCSGLHLNVTISEVWCFSTVGCLSHRSVHIHVLCVCHWVLLS